VLCAIARVVARTAIVTVVVAPGGSENPTVCPVPLFEYQPELPLIDGNYVVRDVQP
jgi:hypothetical protein